MLTDHRAALAKIKRFDQLIAYLRDEMGWPIARDSFEDVDDLFYDFTADELGIDPKTAAKIESIKRLRPLSPRQPWGIFFIKFEPKKLPVVALRRILSQVALKKRASANSAERAAWAADDLLFVSNYGEGDERQISFAHFSQAEAKHDLPTLKVLGWDNLDTALHLDAVAKELTEHLAWPEDDADIEGWRRRWRTAFTLRHREVITTSRELSIRFAELARAIRDRIKTVLAIETERGPLTKLMKAFQEALVHDLDADGFADMYAQTIAYGLLSARIADPHKKTADDFAAHMRTNPFLRELMETFLQVGGRRGKAGGSGIDFDELGVSEVMELLDDPNTHMEAVVYDFGDRNPQEDPVIHFYELFLKEYDAKKRMQRGVFYTPRPIVSYIVRSVDELLRTEFGLKDGLADTTSWGEMAKRHRDLKIPEDVPSHQAFVQVLDPATGTGTFLVEAIELIHRRMTEKWKAQAHDEKKIEALWNEYVPKHLLPRMHGYELLMAPYAIAHLKIGLKLYETGYRFGSEERARVYLTNALEPASDDKRQREFAALSPALAHEAQAVNAIKRDQRFTVVIGNPPWSGHSWNLSPDLRRIVEPYRYVHEERIKEKGALQLEKSIQDDYIKFIRKAELHIERSSAGLTGLVTSHGFLDNPFLRGMRSSVLSSFGKLFVLDLHGNALRGDKSPEGGTDKNVFDIQRTGVAISFFRRLLIKKTTEVQHAAIWGDRNDKYRWLVTNSVLTTSVQSLSPKAPSYLFIREDATNTEEYKKGYSIGEIMPINSKGIVTGRDAFDIAFDKETLIERMQDFVNLAHTDEHLIEKYDLNPSEWWDVRKARAQMPERGQLHQFVRPLLYRPFDIRPCFYHPAVLMSPRRPVMKHLDPGHQNILLATSRMTKGEPFAHVVVSNGLAEAILLSSKTSNNAIIFPLYLYPDLDQNGDELALEKRRQPNFTQAFLRQIRITLGVPAIDGRGDFANSVGVEDIFDYIFAILHSPAYRRRYVDELSRDFPHVPLTGNLELTRALVRLGGELTALHLLESPRLDQLITEFIGGRNLKVDKISWSESTVWVNKAQTAGFKGVPEAVWNFHIGGYQVCEKWLKDRKGRTLLREDIDHYQRIIAALHETIRLMKEIDHTIESHGGWPGAFRTAAATAESETRAH